MSFQEKIIQNAKPFQDIINEAAKKYPRSWNQIKVKIENERWIKESDVLRLYAEDQKIRKQKLQGFWELYKKMPLAGDFETTDDFESALFKWTVEMEKRFEELLSNGS